MVIFLFILQKVNFFHTSIKIFPPGSPFFRHMCGRNKPQICEKMAPYIYIHIYTQLFTIGSNRSRPPGSQGFRFFGQKNSQDYQLFIHIQGCRLSGFFRIRNTNKSVIRILQHKNFFSKIHNDKKTQLFFKTFLFRKNCPRLLQIIVTLLICIKIYFFRLAFFVTDFQDPDPSK